MGGMLPGAVAGAGAVARLRRAGVGAALGWALLLGAGCGGDGGTAPLPPPPPSATATAMLAQLPAQIGTMLQWLRTDLPRNPHLTAQFQAKIAILERPALASEIVGRRLYVDTSAISRGGRIPLVLVFPVDSMRRGAASTAQMLESLPVVLEEFFDRAFPHAGVRVWYGFMMGNLGGGGTIWTEDQGTWYARVGSWNTTPPPYEALAYHELAHSYIGSEPLTQFLEVYSYNVVKSGSSDFARWSYTRQYPGMLDSNTGVLALLDIYRVIGRDAMARAYRALFLLAPPYGEPLSAAAQQAFVDQAPDSLKALVTFKAGRI